MFCTELFQWNLHEKDVERFLFLSSSSVLRKTLPRKRTKIAHSYFLFSWYIVESRRIAGWKLKTLLLTCDSCVMCGLGCRIWERPLPPDGRHFSGTLACVGDARAVLLVCPWALIVVAATVSIRRADISRLCRVVIERSSADCGYLLPLEPAGQRCLTLEVEVPPATVLLDDLLQFQL